jgi:hypothetical protein
MGVARIVTFDDVSAERLTEMERQMQDEQPPDDIPVKEMIVLHDPNANRAQVIMMFDSDEDYQRADVALNAMPAGDTPGTRSAVARYDVAMRISV